LQGSSARAVDSADLKMLIDILVGVTD
jgi:hypothetical protein